MTTEATLPVRPVRIGARKGMACWLWICDVCPHCGARHEHGAGNNPDAPEILDSTNGRASHCKTGSVTSYVLVPA
jgi:hypothetical protein